MDRNASFVPLAAEAQEMVSLPHNSQVLIAELGEHLEYLQKISMVITSPDTGQSLSYRTEDQIICIQDRCRYVIQALNFRRQSPVRQREIAILVGCLHDYVDLISDDEDGCDHAEEMPVSDACTCEISEILKKGD